MQHSKTVTKSCKLARCALAASLLAILHSTAVQATDPLSSPQNRQSLPAPAESAAPAIRSAKIQLAILLDTSNSMDGLIDQTRNQLWQVVNEFSSAKRNGMTPILEIALFEYGNDNYARSQGYMRRMNEFTRELDQVSAGLFALTTNGGSEYCGYAINTAIDSLQWSRAAEDIRIIFIAGNESFSQGPINYRQAVERARRQGIAVNTIHAGDHQEGIDSGWKNGALLAGGDYMSIDANQQVVHIVAPQDKRIAELNARLNQTYIPYGSQGQAKAQRQLEQDEQSSKISGALLAKRAKSKSSSFYRNSNWDLVDAFKDGDVDASKLSTLEESELPEPMQGMSTAGKLEYVQQKADERKKIQQEISELSAARADFVATAKTEQAAAAPSISDALTQAVKKQAQQKNFVLE